MILFDIVITTCIIIYTDCSEKVIIFIVYVVVIFLNALYIQLTGFKSNVSSNQH